MVSDFLLGGVFVLDSPLFFIGGVGGVCHPHRLMSDVVGLLVYRTRRWFCGVFFLELETSAGGFMEKKVLGFAIHNVTL